MSATPSDRKSAKRKARSAKESATSTKSSKKTASKAVTIVESASLPLPEQVVIERDHNDDSPYKIDLEDTQWYLSRELSWLEFNRRVLHEALDERTPLLERLKFLAIFSSNLDEYFMVRVAATKQQIDVDVKKRTPDGRTPSDHLSDISQRLRPMVVKLHSYFQNELRPTLFANGIRLLDYDSLSPTQTDYLDRYFNEQIFPVLTPLAVDSGHPFPYISNLSLNLAVEIQDEDDSHFARVKVPKVLPRFVELPKTLYRDSQHLDNQHLESADDSEQVRCHWLGVPMEQVISHNIAALFPGMSVKSCSTFRITRNADLSVEEDEADDLMLAIEQELRKRRLGGSVVRMEIESGMNEGMRTTLTNELALSEEDIYEVEGFVGLADLMSFMSLPLSELKDTRWKPMVPSVWKAANSGEGEDVFDIIRRRDRLVHHPYQAFSGTVQAFITQAALDPGVLAIKMTLYRTSGDSPIVNALIKAAENGKQVVALVELKARFDEENNINWARTLERSGVHVVYGLMGLKTHTKVALVVRRENKTIRRYVHIGTGNYNPKTASLYTDLGLLSCREELGIDLTDLFNYLTGYSRQQSYKKLLIAPVSLRKKITQFIRQEAKAAKAGNKSRIIAKMNSLVDARIIRELYKASQAGVEIDLIIRGICCLRPGVKGVSENIRVTSVIGRFLEHSRLFYFYNGGEELFYIGSADWMPRNLDRRVEALVPVEDPALQSELADLIEICLNDNRQAWEMQPDGLYEQRLPKAGEPDRSTHKILMKKAKKL